MAGRPAGSADETAAPTAHRRPAVKLGVVGKGGVGKTTLAALLAQAYAQAGQRVLAIDTDSNPNLGLSLGLSVADAEAVPVLPRALLVGRGGGMSAGRLVADYGRHTPAGPVLLSAIRVQQAGAGCTCGGHATVRSLLAEALDEQADVAIVDMEAGLEHLSRSGGTLAHADVLLTVMEPTRKSVLTAARTRALATELGIGHTYGVGNKAHGERDVTFFTDACAQVSMPLLAVVPHDPGVAEADRQGRQVGPAPAVLAAVRQLVERLAGPTRLVG